MKGSWKTRLTTALAVFLALTGTAQAAWDKTKPANNEKLKDAPAQIRANWDAIELGTDASLQITNAKVSASAAIADTKLAQITTAGKVSGAAITLLTSLPAGAGAIPIANIPTIPGSSLGTLNTIGAGAGDIPSANLDGNAVVLTGDQTVAGVKTFSSIPVLPASDPTTDNQAVRKAYVDANAGVVGSIVAYGGATAPTGWMFCDGTAINRTTYSGLFAVIGTSFGVGNGSTTFNLPDLRGRFPLGKDNMGGSSANRVTDADADTVGNADGEETKTLIEANLPPHAHTTPAHHHAMEGTDAIGGGGVTGFVKTNGPSQNDSNTGVPFGADDGSGTSGNGNGSSTAFDVMNPFQTVNYIIKY